MRSRRPRTNGDESDIEPKTPGADPSVSNAEVQEQVEGEQQTPAQFASDLFELFQQESSGLEIEAADAKGPSEADMDEYYSLVDTLRTLRDTVVRRQHEGEELSERDPDVVRFNNLLGKLRANPVVADGFEQAKANAIERINHIGVRECLHNALNLLQGDSPSIPEEALDKAYEKAVEGIQNTKTYPIYFRKRGGPIAEFYSGGAGGSAAGEWDQVTGHIYVGDPALQHVLTNDWGGKSSTEIAVANITDTLVHEAAGHVIPAWAKLFANGGVLDVEMHHEALSMTKAGLRGEDMLEHKEHTDAYSDGITAEDVTAWEKRRGTDRWK